MENQNIYAKPAIVSFFLNRFATGIVASGKSGLRRQYTT
jgi:hypothetical protein